ncbi:MAG: zinc ABC transporter substrate-binding protein [Alphaproteobacteria bacterium]|nr:zinc ABC transporter substrate-binding protein [Alphaproteobacteria bacterium]
MLNPRRLCAALSILAVVASPFKMAVASEIYVAATIKPLHGLVQMVLGDEGQAVMLMPEAASPHHVTLRPSDRRHLSRADLVVIIDPEFETTHAKALPTAQRVLTATSLNGIRLFERRTSGEFGHSDEIESHIEGEEGHDEHDDHAEHAGHSHDNDGIFGLYDLHLWLLPENAKVILTGVAAELSAIYPEHAEDFARNAKAAAMRIDAMDAEIAAMLAPYKDIPLMAYHDAYVYFETHYGLAMVSTVMNHHDEAAGVNRVRQLRKLITASGVKCIFHEPQFNARILDVIDPGKQVARAELDPIGAAIPKGADLYPEMMMRLAKSVKSCLAP